LQKRKELVLFVIKKNRQLKSIFFLAAGIFTISAKTVVKSAEIKRRPVGGNEIQIGFGSLN
jgi:methylglyoxal synthase